MGRADESGGSAGRLPSFGFEKPTAYSGGPPGLESTLSVRAPFAVGYQPQQHRKQHTAN
jgi:hypothetical protein